MSPALHSTHSARGTEVTTQDSRASFKAPVAPSTEWRHLERVAGTFQLRGTWPCLGEDDCSSPADRVGPPPSRQGRSHLEGTSQGWSCKHQVLTVYRGVGVRLTGSWEARARVRPSLQHSVPAVVRWRQSCEATISCRKGGPSKGTQVLLGRDNGY